jgi:DNA ligase 1
MTFKPMLASKLEGDLTFPKMASPKIDGIRCCIVGGEARTRSLKLVPNEHVRAMLEHSGNTGLDGELAVGPVNAKNLMQATMSGVMSEDGQPDFTYWVFDDYSHPGVFAQRLQSAAARVLSIGGPCVMVPHRWVDSLDELLSYEQECLTTGYEGVMVRDADGAYKTGRATWKSQALVKVKRFTDAEASRS